VRYSDAVLKQTNMKKPLLLMMIAATTVGSKNLSPLHAQNTPPNAASTKTWTFDNQTWSDAICIPACNKESFTKSDTDPHCHSHTLSAYTWCYYNWEYVSRNAATMCPLPWRMPTKEDFDTLMENKSTGFHKIWGLGGRANASAMENVSVHGNYWSSTEDGSQRAIRMYYGRDGMAVERFIKYYGLQVRCVK
jgi:hypothetical protein